MGEPKQAAIFDLDGIFVDSFEAHLESWRRLAKEREYLFTKEDFTASFGRRSREIIVEHWARELDDDTLADLDARKQELFNEILVKNFHERPGVVRLVEGLVRAGFSLAIGSSAPGETVDLVLDRLGCRDAFETIVTSDDVENGKPEPEIFLKAADQMGVEPSRCVVIEDAAPGVAAGKAAGMMVVGLFAPSGPACCLSGADVVGTSVRQLSADTLAELIERRGRRLV